MLGRLALADDFRRCRLATNGPLDRFLDGPIVEVVDLLVVGGVPMDEDTDADENVVGLGGGDRSIGDAVRHRRAHPLAELGGRGGLSGAFRKDGRDAHKRPRRLRARG